MKPEELEKFRNILLQKRKRMLVNLRHTLNTDMTLNSADLPDETDPVPGECPQPFKFRLRGRERAFIEKIDKALIRIIDGSFGICEDCGEPIHSKRLEARPETTVCVRCKEEHELREERQFAK
ncbi:MAG: TraR/DksA C4-type zinc finger protein [Spirochaetes bacterium]|nr:TraR/DksA C4-type zinc finger protein [Spirochaetota bacterium]MBN2769379.1 TraR/DksA C4-type zinc finger protein [Spirochaetota bacterium]